LAQRHAPSLESRPRRADRRTPGAGRGRFRGEPRPSERRARAAHPGRGAGIDCPPRQGQAGAVVGRAARSPAPPGSRGVRFDRCGAVRGRRRGGCPFRCSSAFRRQR
jgi:hypothetical protein